jgi:nucleoside-diphosphate-sugar epimerase
MNKILITGGSGFIGTNLLDYLLNSGNKVLNIDKNPPKIKSHFSYWNKCDINDLDLLEKITIKFQPNYIIHLAARTDLDGITIDDYKTNILGVENIILAAKKIDCLQKIIFTSSMLVCKVGYQPLNNFDYKPNTIYGESKVLTEKIVWDNQLDCDWSIIRPTSIWGPWFNEPYRFFFDRVIQGRYFHIGSKSGAKTYGFVGNSVHQIYKIMFSNTKNSLNKVFYIGDNPENNIEEWANEIASELGQKIIRLPFIIIKLASYFGDFLKLIGVKFPLTSFRLKNMTTNNVIDLFDTYEIAKKNIYNRQEGTRKTLEWITKIKNNS